MTLDAYTLTWDEVLAEGEARKDAVVSIDGYLLCSPDRKLDERRAKEQHLFSVAKAIAAGKPVPDPVRQWYEQIIIARGIKPDHARRAAFDPPPPAKDSAVLVNAKGKKFSWSYTALTAFENCPAAYAAERFFCTTTFVETEAIIWGNRVHKAAEDMVKGLKVTDLEALAPVEKYAQAFLRQKQLGTEVEAEMEIALTENMKPVSWFAKDAWFRVKLDVTVLKALPTGGVQANLYDYKTGKPKDDPDQLRICSAALSIVRPEIETFVPKFIWTKTQTVTGCEEITKEQVPGIWEGILGRVERMQAAWRSGNFPARASGLCPWCSVYNECKYARRK